MSSHAHALEHQNHADSIDVFGFWIYIMTDCILFASLFAAYIVLHAPGAYGPAFKSFIELPYVLGETFFLLGSNLTFGLSALSMYKDKKKTAMSWLALTFLLGAGFVFMEVNEFIHLAAEGYSWHTSGAASAFFVLVGTHGFHVSVGLLWIMITIFQIKKFGFCAAVKRRMTYLGLFWNFLDIVWIFLFYGCLFSGGHVGGYITASSGTRLWYRQKETEYLYYWRCALCDLNAYPVCGGDV